MRFGFFNALKKTKEAIINNLSSVFKTNTITEKTIEQLERALLLSDVGVKTTQHLVDKVKQNASSIQEQQQTLHSLLRNEMISIFKESQRSAQHTIQLKSRKSPTVLFVVGVNGVGKTTTTAKLCNYYKTKMKRNVVLAAADMHRAAAVEQLIEWGKKTDTKVFSIDKQNNKHVTSEDVIFHAIQESVIGKENVDLVIVDTAGRLQTNSVAMNELNRMRDAASKAKKGAPDFVFLVLDATIGQNAIEQAKAFSKHLRVNGIIVTKLDGTAKGGVVLAIANELKIPVLFIGTGEKVEDLELFDTEKFVDAILENDDTKDELKEDDLD